MARRHTAAVGATMGGPDLFDSADVAVADREHTRPLAERLRPRTLQEVVGQDQLLGPSGFLRRAIESDRLPSMIFWGPPGTGKTTIARLVAHYTSARFVPFSAVLGGVAEVRAIVAAAESASRMGKRTILFVDEIHRFNKSQQDAFLPHVEAGTVTLIGATTDNPSFALNSALLSRCRVLTLKPLDADALRALLARALEDGERGLAGLPTEVTSDAIERIVREADGDARRALGVLEAAVGVATEKARAEADDPFIEPRVLVDVALLGSLDAELGPRYDRSGEEHYNVISAFIKSLRGSDPDAAIYYLARMLASGEDPRFICRRLVIFAAEDVSNADPHALTLAMSTAQAHEMLGLPESRIPMAQAVAYLACAPKSKASYHALADATATVEASGALDVPLHLRNAPTRLMKDLGYGRDYQDPHAAGGWVAEHYLPSPIAQQTFYHPTRNGAEARIADRLETWRRLREERKP